MIVPLASSTIRVTFVHAHAFHRWSADRFRHTTLRAMANQNANQHDVLLLSDAVKGYGFTFATQPWLVNGLSHYITSVAPQGAAARVSVWRKRAQSARTPRLPTSGHHMHASTQPAWCLRGRPRRCLGLCSS